MSTTTATRGKCRHCAASVNDASGPWHDEAAWAEPQCCPAAPTTLCEPCSGAGTLYPPNAEPIPCPPCAGTGEIPGPHWPWRHPEPAAVTR